MQSLPAPASAGRVGWPRRLAATRESTYNPLVRTCVQGGLLVALCAAGVAGAIDELALDAPGDVVSRESAVAEPAMADELTGLWSRYERKAEGGPIRFWYFHGNGKGLYRYGKVGLNTTNSFDYRVVDGQLELEFRKTGDVHRIGFEIRRDENGDAWLSLADDPKEPGARYRKERGGMSHGEVATSSSPGPGGRLWIDYRNFATGGAGFHMYQLNQPAIDGRGIGWYHEGDFDDWSTESLTYRIDGDHLELFFDLREEPTVTHFTTGMDGGTDDEAHRWLELQRDPRDFWATHRFLDGGASFGGAEVWHWVTSH